MEKLIAERLKPGADKEAVDKRIWDLFGEEWAVMFTDLSGFSRKVAEFGIIHFLQIISESERLYVPYINRHDGILLKTEGDSLMVIFRKPVRAIECAITLGEDTAKAWEILATGSLKDAVQGAPGISFEPIDAIPSGASSAHRLCYKL